MQTSAHEIAQDVFRISTSLPPEVLPPTGFTMNQFLIRDEQSLLFHSGPRAMFESIREAVAGLIDLSNLRYVAFSHLESDECGALNQWLAAAPNAVPVCSQMGAILSIGDLADRPPHPLSDGETLDLGRHRVRWIDAPHVPHGIDCGYLFEETTRTLMCGDLFTQGGADPLPLTENDILEPSEAFRAAFEYYAPVDTLRPTLERLAATQPRVLACMHGSSYRGDGAAMLRRLADVLAPAVA